MNELSLKEKMQVEAMERLGLLNTKPLARAKILNDWKITKCVVDFENEKVNDEAELTEEEIKLIRDFEERYGAAVYYVIQDQGLWPDGCMFPRYSLLYVSKYEEEWQMDKEECIVRCKTIPSYVINMEEPVCSGITEIGYKIVNGMILNIT